MQHFETIEKALAAAVDAAGGAKKVGPQLWPELEVEAAQKKLLHGLSTSHPENLKPATVRLILKLARQRGFHDAATWFMSGCGYDAVPIDPSTRMSRALDVVAQASQALNAAMSTLDAIRSEDGLSE